MTASPNILLIVLDALRDDALDDSLQVPGRSIRAPVCVASAPWTLPSCTSIVTGVPATEHGRYWWTSERRVHSLVTSLPDSYRKVGLVNNNMLTEGSGIEEGFDSWTYFHDHEEPFRQALRTIKKTKRERPLLLLLHSNIAHDYYQPAAAKVHRQIFPGDAEPRVLNHRVITWKNTTPDERASVPRTYTACATRLRERVGAVLDAVRQRDDFVTCVTADHGEGLDYERGRVHHGGRVHQDLLHVPLFFDLPTARAGEAGWLSDVVSRGPLAGTDILPTLLALAGQGPEPEPRPGHAGDVGPVLRAEDRRYLYFRDRFRLNLHGRYKNMSAEERERNEELSAGLTEPPSGRAFVRYPEKLTVTSLALVANGDSPTELRRRLSDLGAALPGAPVLTQKGSRLYAFARYDLSTDPAEDQNLLANGADWAQSLLDGGWGPSVSMPEDGDEVGLPALVDSCELLAASGS
jgi:arylsulfatase A-like enzyme